MCGVGKEGASRASPAILARRRSEVRALTKQGLDLVAGGANAILVKSEVALVVRVVEKPAFTVVRVRSVGLA